VGVGRGVGDRVGGRLTTTAGVETGDAVGETVAPQLAPTTATAASRPTRAIQRVACDGRSIARLYPGLRAVAAERVDYTGSLMRMRRFE
jgi:hypothetical protein